nr:cationic amino acid transporter 5 [Quercus suber]
MGEYGGQEGPAVVLPYVISGISALLSVFCYTEFAVEIPVADNVSGVKLIARLDHHHRSIICLFKGRAV